MDDAGEKVEEACGGVLQQEGELTRTNTDVTLVDGNEEKEELALKALRFVSMDEQGVSL